MKSASTSFSVINPIIKQIISISKQNIIVNQNVNKNFKEYSFTQSFILITEMSNQVFRVADKIQQYQHEKQPIGISADNMTSANMIQNDVQQIGELSSVYNKNQSPTLRKKAVSSLSQRSSRAQRGEKKLNVKQKYQKIEKLDQTNQQQEQNIIIQMRKHIEQNEKKIKIECEQKKKLLHLKKNEKFIYDYDGNFLKEHNVKRTNLVQQKIQGQISIDIKRKESIIKKVQQNSEKINGKVIVNQQKKKVVPKPLEKSEIVLSGIQDLTKNLLIKKGVKFTQNAKSIEMKQKQQSLTQIKRSIITRKVSHSEYKKIKENQRVYTEKSQLKMCDQEKIHDNEINETSIKELKRIIRFKTETMINKPTKSSRIIVSNRQQRQNLLTEKKQFNQQQSNLPIQSVYQKKLQSNLGPVDLYNLQYVNKKGVMKQQKRKKSQLPLIPSHNSVFPKQREKLKQASIFIRQYRKKFQENLRK